MIRVPHDKEIEALLALPGRDSLPDRHCDHRNSALANSRNGNILTKCRSVAGATHARIYGMDTG